LAIVIPLVVIVIPLVVAAGIAWHYGLFNLAPSRPPANSMMIIAPYRHDGTWVFDDPRVGLVREPFVAGVPEMIDVLVANAEIKDADNGFRLLFSAKPFPGHQEKLTWVRGEAEGNYYRLEDPPMEGWLCPALFKYFAKAPKELYVKAEPKQ
jgi:hypothetical protein